MRKALYISLMLMGLFSDAAAQKKFVYEDTSLLQQEEISTPVEDIIITQDSTGVAGAPITALDEDDKPVDTSLHKNDLGLSYDSIKNWRNLKEYAYSKYLDSLLKDLKKEAPRQTSMPGPGIFTGLFSSPIVSALLWTLAIVFVLFILYRLFLADGAFRRKTKKTGKPEAEVEEEVITGESNFDALIRQAVQAGNYRQAVRYQYLRTLHLLADKNQVQLAPDKTNFQYVNEIADRNYQQRFASLTLNYEYVWYGEFEIDKTIYEKIEGGFHDLNQKI